MKLNTYIDKRKRAEETSINIRNDNEKTIHPTDFYVNSLNQVKSELEKSIGFLQEVSNHPTLLFTEAKDHWGSHRNILFQCVNYSGKEKEQGTVHEFQVFLASKMNQSFQIWLRKEGISYNLNIEVRNANKFPSNYAVYMNHKEMLIFNIFEKTYGVRTKAETEDNILKAGKKEETRLKEDEKKEQKELDELYVFREKPFSLSLQGIYQILFQRERTMKRINDMIAKQEDKLESIKERIKRNQKQLPLVLKENEDRREIFNLIEPFFKQFNYLLEENHTKLS